jgi:hypothetical protein
MIIKGINAMPALAKFLVLLVLVLLASHATAFTSLSSVAGNQVRINHLTRLQQPISDPTNEPSCKPKCKPTKQIDLDAVLPNNLSQINNVVLSNHSNQWEFLADQPGIDEEINYPIAASDSFQPTPINLDSSGLHCSSRTEVLNRHGLVYSDTTLMDHDERLTSPQITHLRSASQQSFSSARIPFSTICPFGGLSCWVQSLAVKVQVSSTPKVSRHAFALFAFEPVTSTKQISSPNTALNATAEMQLSADISQDPGPLAEQPIAVTNSSQFNLPEDSLHTASQNPNETSQLIVRYFITVRFKQMQQDLVNFSLLKTISIAKLGTSSIAF